MLSIRTKERFRVIQLSFRPSAFVLCMSAVIGLAAGCGESTPGQRLSGKVNFNGKPVPAGKIFVSPDSGKGNSGPTGFAEIKDGVYDTGLPGGRPVPHGAVVMTIEGIDPTTNNKADPSGEVTVKLLFAGYELKTELPESASTKDIDVPPEAAKGPVAPKVKQTITP